MRKTSTVTRLLLWGIGLIVILMGEGAAVAAGAMTIGQVATQITKSFGQLSKLMTAGCYLAGIGFSIGAIMKFKQHKDNPTQVPVGTPIALMFIAASLLFLPTILSVSGATIFPGGTTGGASGITWTNS